MITEQGIDHSLFKKKTDNFFHPFVSFVHHVRNKLIVTQFSNNEPHLVSVWNSILIRVFKDFNFFFASNYFVFFFYCFDKLMLK
jgi:hypothetical protein